jgi:transposase
MQQRRLSSEEVRFIVDLKSLNISNVEIAEKLGITEGAVRYRIKRVESGKEDGRTRRSSMLHSYQGIIGDWIEEHKDSRHRPTLKALFEQLRTYHHYAGSYDALRRYIRKYHSRFLKKGSRIRIETPPGVLMQVDWKEDILVQFYEPGHWVKVNALCFSLGFSRKMVVLLSDTRTLNAFISCHNKAFRRFGGLPSHIRPDCLKSAIVRWRGQRSILNERYRKYMQDLGVDVFPSRPGTPTDKGKIEKKIQDLFGHLDFKAVLYSSLGELQTHIDEKLKQLEEGWLCGATGLSVRQSFDYERRYLRSLPEFFPQLPVKEMRSTVREDGTVYFDGNYYQLPDVYIAKSVLCLHTGQAIHIYHSGEEVSRFNHLPGVKGMVRLSEDALHSENIYLSDTVRTWALEVARRQVDIYHELVSEGP